MPQTPAQPRVIRKFLGTPDAIVVETSAGEVIVVADHAVSDEDLAAIVSAAQYLPTAADAPLCVPVDRRQAV